jgi:predicted nucleic acid-binding protein
LSIVLDSWAILRYLQDHEPTSGEVAELLDAERPIVSWINLGEVFYVICRLHGQEAASDAVRDLREVITPETPTEARILEAAHIKGDHAMAYADAFAAATAIAHSATLWTGDPELLINDAPWQWRDLRS